MPSQEQGWSEVAKDYDDLFIDPYRLGVRNPLRSRLARLAKGGARVVGDLGCGLGPLLPFLAERYDQVFAVDFAPGMLERARQRCAGTANVKFLERSLRRLHELHGKLDVAVAVNSLVMADPAELDECLAECRRCLRPGGTFLAIVPAMDSIHYCTMLLLDRALAQGKPLAAARKNAASLGEHELYDFAFGLFRFKGLVQRFWWPFEIALRLKRAGLIQVRQAKVSLAWSQFACARDLQDHPPPWDWLVQGTAPERGENQGTAE